VFAAAEGGPAFEGEEGEGDAEEAGGFGEGGGGVVGGEGAERRESEGAEAGALGLRRWCEARGKEREEAALGEREKELDPEDGHEVAHAERDEDGREKKWEAGETDERGADARGFGEAEDVVADHVLSEVGVELGVADEERVVVKEVETQERAR